MVFGRGRKHCLGGDRGRRKREIKEKEGGGTSRFGVGRNWSLSIFMIPAHTRGTVKWDLLKCKQEEKIWALWVAVELVITYLQCMCVHACAHTDLLTHPFSKE